MLALHGRQAGIVLVAVLLGFVEDTASGRAAALRR